MLVRCSDHFPAQGYKAEHIANPAGHPTAAICGRCEREGRVFLNEDEWDLYTNGKVIFDFNNDAVRIRVEKYSPTI